MPQPGDAPPAANQENLADRLEQVSQSMELADPDANASAIDRWINRVAELIGVVVLATIVLLVFANAVGRYLAASPIIWAEEIVIASIPWLAMSGVFLSVRRRQVIRLEYFTLRMPPIVRTAIESSLALLSAATFVLLAFYSFQYVSLFGHDLTTYVKVPTGFFTASMVIGAVATALAFLVNGYLELRTRRTPAGTAAK